MTLCIVSVFHEDNKSIHRYKHQADMQIKQIVVKYFNINLKKKVLETSIKFNKASLFHNQ